MFVSSAPRATARAALWAGAAVARAQFGAGLAALILALLARLLARTEAAWDLSPEFDDAFEGECPYAPTLFVMGSAPHAAAFEAGLVPDWIFTSVNRGMRPKSALRRAPSRARSARAPPLSCAARS